MNDTLWNDLSLVLPARREVASAVVTTYVRGQACDVGVAITRCVELLRDARRPALTGLNLLTIEALRAAMTLAMRCDARVLPEVCEVSLDVAQHATLGHVLASDYILIPGPARWAADHPVAAVVARRVLHNMFITPGLDGVLSLRAQVRARGSEAITGTIPQPVGRVAVLLPPGTDIQTLSQWHKLATDVQGELRMCVMLLPDLATFGNGRGVLEVVTWRSGFAGPVQFDGRRATRCRMGLADVDMAIELGALRSTDAAMRVVFALEPDETAEVSFVTPGLAMGLAAHVCRFDGQMLRLCNDLGTAPPDPTVALLERLAGDV